ncbi:hypothetical protein AADZ90_015530 [Aestuariibius sp. 2305UL40-4]|uniref:hypothetical protein n=1 Tax=Aestuariibius violaceus TaxID=3234132 RepID=UPI00345EF96E
MDDTDFAAILGREFMTELDRVVEKVTKQDGWEVFSMALGEEPSAERLEHLDEDDYEALAQAAVEYFEEDDAAEADFEEIVRATLDTYEGE